MVDAENPKDDDLSSLTNLWDQRAEGINPEIDWNRPITPAEMAYLHRQMPFLQLINTKATFANFQGVTFQSSSAGWVIHDLDDALSTSPGLYLFGGASEFPLDEKDEEDEGGTTVVTLDEEGQKVVNYGQGTIVNQAFVTAAEMIKLITDRWAGIEIVDGTDLMKWAAWVIAQEMKKEIIGFEATKEDERKRDRLRRSLTLSKLPAMRPAKNR